MLTKVRVSAETLTIRTSRPNSTKTSFEAKRPLERPWLRRASKPEVSAVHTSHNKEGLTPWSTASSKGTTSSQYWLPRPPRHSRKRIRQVSRSFSTCKVWQPASSADQEPLDNFSDRHISPLWAPPLKSLIPHSPPRLLGQVGWGWDGGKGEVLFCTFTKEAEYTNN
ncbi:hypothetical protein E2C01_009320 [Portunus trituberculatus]|uniref:Uncharacterized protein n=1 Tax=Portunus trituberculatus TaxID=210409 RepID=A0A5B7D5G6_PORTR|nr:hypothetical protein [Portunus trituberculatus]